MKWIRVWWDLDLSVVAAAFREGWGVLASWGSPASVQVSGYLLIHHSHLELQVLFGHFLFPFSCKAECSSKIIFLPQKLTKGALGFYFLTFARSNRLKKSLVRKWYGIHIKQVLNPLFCGGLGSLCFWIKTSKVILFGSKNDQKWPFFGATFVANIIETYYSFIDLRPLVWNPKQGTSLTELLPSYG